MSKFMFVINDNGIESWYPVDEKGGSSEYGGTFMGLAVYKFRARSNWHRGSYYMEAELTAEQEETLKKLLAEKDWLGGKKFVESTTGRNFETETGYENPYDPNEKPDYGPEWTAKHDMWQRRAGLTYLIADENPEDKIRELKSTIGKVFQELEKENYLARMNYYCCCDCADDALIDEATELREAGKIVEGIVYYDEQAEECLWDNGFVPLFYRNLNGTGGLNTFVKKLGEHLVKKFESAGAIVVWNGDPDRVICLHAW